MRADAHAGAARAGSRPTSVLLVDDHAVVRAGYRRFLEMAGDIRVMGEAADGDGAYRAYAAAPCDVIVLDISLPGVSGLETARRILQRDAGARILVCSIHQEAVFVQRALDAGVRGYVSKNSSPEVLVAAVKEVAGGRLFLSADVERSMCAAHAGQAALEVLSGREFEVFRLLAAGCSVAAIARTLCLSDKTVANYNTHIRKKLGAANAAELARLAIRYGILSAGTARSLE